MVVHTVSAKGEAKVDSFDTFWACWTTGPLDPSAGDEGC